MGLWFMLLLLVVVVILVVAITMAVFMRWVYRASPARCSLCGFLFRLGAVCCLLLGFVTVARWSHVTTVQRRIGHARHIGHPQVGHPQTAAFRATRPDAIRARDHARLPHEIVTHEIVTPRSADAVDTAVSDQDLPAKAVQDAELATDNQSPPTDSSADPAGGAEQESASKRSTTADDSLADSAPRDDGETAVRDTATDPVATGSSEAESSDIPPAAASPIRLSEVVIDFEARPEWVEYDEDMNVGPTYRVSVSSGPHVRYRDARKELRKQLEIEARQYINELLDSPRAATWLGFDQARVQRELVKPDHIYDEKIISPSFGVMHQTHALLEFGPEFRDTLQSSWNNVVACGRLAGVGLLGGVILGILGMLLTYFRADTATKGFYTRRLRFATVLVILGLIAAGAVLARSIPWIWL